MNYKNIHITHQGDIFLSFADKIHKVQIMAM